MAIRRRLFLEYALLGLVSAAIPGVIGLTAAQYTQHTLLFSILTAAAVVLAPGCVLLLFHRRLTLRAELLEKAVAAAGVELADKATMEIALRNLFLRQLEIRDREEVRKEMDRGRLIERLLGDNKHTLAFADAPEQLDKLVRQDVLQMPHPGFCLLCLRIDDYDQIFHRRGQTNVVLTDYVKIRNTIQDTLRACAPEGSNLYCVEYSGCYTCLINLELDPGADSRETLRSIHVWCERVILQLDTDHDIMAIAALSTPFFDISNAHEALYECLGLFRYADMLSMEQPVISALDIPTDTADADTHQKQLWKKYVHAATTLDMPKARDLLLELLDPKFITSPQQAESVSQMVLFHLGIAFETLGCVVEKKPELNLLCRQISSAASLEELSSLVQQVFDQLDLANLPEGKKESKAQQLQQYIDEHYMDPDLNLTILSDRFSMNPSYVARIFKEATGLSVLAYLQQQRLNSAKHLLETTGLNLTDIALRTGYASGWTLTRAFKRSEGVTPGAYRQMSQSAT